MMRTFFQGLWLKIKVYCRTYSLWELVFCLSSAGFVVFGMLAQALCCLIPHLPCTDYLPFWSEYLPGLLFSLGIGSLFYYLIAHLSRRKRIFQILATVFLVALLLIESFCLLAFMAYGTELWNFDDEYPADEIVNGWHVDELHHKGLISDSALFGSGPDTSVPSYHSDLSGRQSYPIFPLLSYVYGYWILILFSLLGIVWLLSGVRVYLKLYRRWHEWLFLLAFLLYAIYLIYAMLGFLGLVPCVELCPFTGHWIFMCLLPIPLLSTMCAVLKLNNDAV